MLLSVTEFIGRFHPALVHLPIGILLMGILLQWLSASPKYNISDNVIRIVLLIGTFSAILSCITGFFLSSSDDYETDLVSWHMWMGIGVAAASLLFLQRILTKQKDITTRLTSISLLVLIVLTGHFGGSLTHGPDYLTAALNAETDTVVVRKPIANIQEAVVYEDIIQPVLQTKCYSCHSSKKQKGGLRVDDPQFLLKGGKTGEAILPGKAEESELVKRLLLPLEDEDHMPPKSKPQLKESEIALIHWWVNGGADFAKKVKDLPQPEKLQPVLLALQSGNEKPKAPLLVPETPVETADANAVNALKNSGVVVIPVAAGSNYLSANFVTVPAVTPEQLQLLLPLKKQLVWLKLNDTRITDAALGVLHQLTSLRTLSLNNTAITDAGLATLKPLVNLQVLSVVNTKVTATGLAQLSGLKNLHSLYAYQTGVKAADTPGLRKSFPTASINIGSYTLPLLSSDTVRLGYNGK
ncbi:MAG TPA: c-type cytochrome domain-containing protein [Flavisolibacter sp.]|nr:c-type cytochrome domain-containing protein [Flavisolibacter sp.]